MFRLQDDMLLVIGLCGVAVLLADQPGPATPVILISIDTLRADHLSAYGYKKIHTPNIDSFAENGSLFANISAQVPLTLPSHTTLFTSTYPFQNHVEENAERVPAGAETLASVLGARGYKTAAFIGSVFLEKQLGLDKGFELYDSPFSFEAMSPLSGEMIFAGATRGQYAARDTRGGALVIRAAHQWLLQNRTQPVFAFVHLFDLHKPYSVPEEVASARGISRYDAQLEAMDQTIGAFKQALMREGWWDRSIVILLADHGEGLGDHGENSHGYFIYQSTLHVPLLIHWPIGFKHAARVERPGGLIDVAPTILDALHVPMPASFVGHSLLRDESSAVYAESVYTRDAFGWAALRSLQSGPFKYIQAPKPELYDLEKDPQEKTNLIRSNPSEARVLKGELADLLAKHATRQAASGGEVVPNANSVLGSLGYLGKGPRAKSLSAADPKDRLAEYLQYEEAVDAGYARHTDAAIAGLLKLLGKDPGNILARRDLGECYIQQQDYVKARASFQQVLAAVPDDYASHLGMGIADQHLGRAKEAAEQMQAACRIAPDAAQCRKK